MFHTWLQHVQFNASEKHDRDSCGILITGHYVQALSENESTTTSSSEVVGNEIDSRETTSCDEEALAAGNRLICMHSYFRLNSLEEMIVELQYFFKL